MSSPVDSRLPNLEQQRKRAKDLCRAHRGGHEQAAERIRRCLPRAAGRPLAEILASPFALADAQHVVATEAGFASWPSMKRHVEQSRLDAAGQEAAAVVAALRGDDGAVAELLASAPELASRSLHVGAALLDAAAVDSLLAARPELATAAGGPHDATALVYACCSRMGVGNAERDAARLRIVAALLATGASPSDGYATPDVTRGWRTAVAGAVACARSVALVRTLIEAGADPEDGPTLYEGSALYEAVRLRDLGAVRSIVEHGPPQWHLDHAASQCLQREDPELLGLLLANGASANAIQCTWSRGGTCLHEAIQLCRSTAVVALLLEAGADVAQGDRDARTPLAVAVRTAQDDAARVLRELGAGEGELTDVDRALAACLRGERPALSDAPLSLGRSDHQMLSWAIRTGRVAAIPALLALGLDPAVADDDGQTPLHLAAAAGDSALVKRLIDAGARVEAADFAGRRPAAVLSDRAGDGERDALAQLLAIRAAATPRDGDARGADFERAADAVVSGDAEALRALLEATPSLATAHSPRRHRATLLHYLGANGVETQRQRTPSNAVEIAHVLFAAGADPNALCLTYRGGPDQTTLGLLSTSDHPAEAGLMLPLIECLRDAGAELDGVDGDGAPLAGAIAQHSAAGVAALVEAGARIDNVLFAAAAGRVDLVERAVDATGRLRPGCWGARAISMARDPKLRVEQALGLAARFGHLDVVRLLLDRGVDVDSAPADGVTPLHEAAHNGHREVVDLLLSGGANPCLRDERFGGWPAGWAQAGGHEALGAYLDEVGEARSG